MNAIPGALAILATAVYAVSSPKILHVGAVDRDMVALTVQAGRIEGGRQAPYLRQAGDETRTDGKERQVFRNGEFLGWLVGKSEKMIFLEDRLIGKPLDVRKADLPGTYVITSSDDAAYARGLHPVAVYRKSKPSDFGRWNGWPYRAPVRHMLYLRLPKPLSAGAHYTIRTKDLLTEQKFLFDPRTVRSEAVHINQIGFRPDDPEKRAFLSLWAGTGGAIEYADGTAFHVIDTQTATPVFSGVIRLIHRPGDVEDAYKKDYAGTYVYEMDFSDLHSPGTYHVSVDGVGCSYPFPIAVDTWRRAFRASARGFYHQHSGIALGPPFTTYRRPLCFHPNDNVVVYQSTCPLMYSGNGLNALGTDTGNFGNLVKGKTDRIVPNAWGGYMDAGDWDRRIQHLIVARYLLDLAEVFPAFFEKLSLDIPESSNALPDVVDEALYGVDFFRRLQTTDGGVSGGIESSEHPRHGECSWQESLTVLSYAPGIWSSYVYAGVAAKTAAWFSNRDDNRMTVYRDSALRAMEWAEKGRARMQDSGKFERWRKPAANRLRDARNLAAADLFRLTGDARWNRVFLDTTAFTDPAIELFVWQKSDQRDAAWTYVRTSRDGVDLAVQRNCRNAILREAGERLRSIDRSSFRYAKYAWAPGAYGAFSSPDAVSILWAYILRRENKYLRGALLACLTGAGANPVNLCYTTGLGSVWPLHPLHIDSRITHQPAPPGLTVFGPMDVVRNKGYWAQRIVDRYCCPEVLKWPTLEAYWDVFWDPPMCEFTVQSPMARNAYVWGVLAARPELPHVP